MPEAQLDIDTHADLARLYGGAVPLDSSR